jgi:hypothetical protein
MIAVQLLAQMTVRYVHLLMIAVLEEVPPRNGKPNIKTIVMVTSNIPQHTEAGAHFT